LLEGQPSLDDRVHAHLLITRDGRALDRFVERGPGAIPVSGLRERRSKVGKHAEPQWVVEREQRRRPSEEVDGRRVIAPGERPLPRCGEAPTSLIGELLLSLTPGA